MTSVDRSMIDTGPFYNEQLRIDTRSWIHKLNIDLFRYIVSVSLGISMNADTPQAAQNNDCFCGRSDLDLGQASLFLGNIQQIPIQLVFGLVFLM